MNSKNIILDLDETLVHTMDVRLPTGKEGRLLTEKYKDKLYIIDTVTVNNTNQIKYEKLWGLTRPGLNEFMNFCFNNFNYVIIWSAGTERYVKDTVNRTLCDLKCPRYVFTQKDCYADEEGYLSKPISYLKSNNPELIGLDLNNTLLIDDRKSNFESEPHNGIQIPEFNPDKEDIALYDLIKWFKSNDFRRSIDVRTLNKKSIFE